MDITNYTKNLHNFISKSNIYASALGFLITTQVISISNAFFDNLIAPIINNRLNRNKNEKFKDYVITIDDINLEIGAFLLILFKFIFIIFLVSLFLNLFKIEIQGD